MPSSDPVSTLRDDERVALVTAADVMAEQARTNAAQFSQQIASAIEIGEVVETPQSIGISLEVHGIPFAKETEEGYPVTIINGRPGPMIFEGTKGYSGQVIHAFTVTHPEMSAKPYLSPAIVDNIGVLDDALAASIDDAVTQLLQVWVTG